MFTIKESIEWSLKTEALVIGLYQDQKKLSGVAEEIDALLDGYVTEYLRDGEVRAEFKTVSKVHTLGKIGAKRIYFVGLGKKQQLTAERISQVFGKLTKVLYNDEIEEMSLLFDSFQENHLNRTKHLSKAIAESILLASYRFADYKEKDNRLIKKLEQVTIYSKQNKEDLKQGLKKGAAYGEGTNFARTLVNIPANLLTPTDLADYAQEIAEKYEMEIEILEKEEMEKLGMGALLAVNQGTDQPPKMIVLKYQGRKEWNQVVSFVGKGVTYDSGGLSIKTREGMIDMKSDMGGAAAVLGAMDVIGKLKPEINLLAVIPTAENLINGSALKPGDVITSLSGKTIEVLNTDAEGRLILADGITYAKQLGANYLVDVATLTGAAVIALGESTTGALTNNKEWYEKVEKSAEVAGEYMWLLPSFDFYKKMVKSSSIADLNNSPGRPAGAITAGLFLGEFAGVTPWVHLDIAGPSYTKRSSDLNPKGGTGVMVRTLAELALTFS
ncbi:leucyl aminopeptidase [Bacillus taeanensis]|uniref:leucyl aminopeptidase n=1 Tax=Bacillus taeanensis TaxID=273032 RepID=UPI001FE48B7B|nr:leucyl aminopeptidase [Bacillus taeanensis]